MPTLDMVSCYSAGRDFGTASARAIEYTEAEDGQFSFDFLPLCMCTQKIQAFKSGIDYSATWLLVTLPRALL